MKEGEWVKIAPSEEHRFPELIGKVGQLSKRTLVHDDTGWTGFLWYIWWAGIVFSSDILFSEHDLVYLNDKERKE